MFGHCKKWKGVENACEDPNIADTKTRCSTYAKLFLKVNSGDDYWNEQKYLDLGCAKYNPWTMEPAGERTL
jgi:hypothetical protein